MSGRSMGCSTFLGKFKKIASKMFLMDIVHYLQIALLAVIQGAAELLPVSSSAHVILAQRIMGMNPSENKQVFLLVMLHTGTMFAVLVYFWPRWRRLLSAPAPTPGAESPRRH